MATAPSPNDLTRQQLDELDALLQRMLSVPLSPVDTPLPVGTLPAPTPPAPAPVSAPIPNWRADPDDVSILEGRADQKRAALIAFGLDDATARALLDGHGGNLRSALAEITPRKGA